MGIFSSHDPGPWRTPETGPALVLTHVTANGDGEVTIRPGADVEDVTAALAFLPPGMLFRDHYGDVDVVLVFQRNPAGPPALDGAPLVPASPLIPAAAGVSHP